jgi:hypothetical protein
MLEPKVGQIRIYKDMDYTCIFTVTGLKLRDIQIEVSYNSSNLHIGSVSVPRSSAIMNMSKIFTGNIELYKVVY